VEAMTDFAESNEHPQGEKKFIGQIHQCFGHQYISKVSGGKLGVVHRTEIADGLYQPEADYTKQPL
jgi:branched-chain amino acid transport system substrate-binding protein